ncbi:hypothetical protein [Plantactinospora sp. BB1]|uniref:hypothetical protein n=1 Tax=Plantactinospora sp. BB1 TaxID=2071627 RepID=UPI000D17DC69|nr:hypothetical protein [Plantactinospora sp. BB1]AVT37160.1 hypothetical protein C6W10_12600 [Plantactinospora sp. BB1]
MRRRVLAAVMGMLLFLTGTARPAAAADFNRYLDMIRVTAVFLDSAADGLTPAELVQFTQDIKGALAGVETDLLTQLNNLQIADVRSQVRYAINGAQMMDVPPLLPLYVNTVYQGTNNAREKLTEFDGDAERDIVGKALIAQWEVLLIAQARVPNMRVMYAEYQEALEHIIRNVRPTCKDSIDNPTGTLTHTCTFNGRTVTGQERTVGGRAEHHYGDYNWQPGELSRPTIVDRTMAETALDLAERALADLLRPRP